MTLCDGSDDGLKNIGIVIGFLLLQGHAEPFESHAGIHMFLRKVLQLSAGLPVELDKDQVPDLDHQGMVLVDQLCTRDLFTFGLIPQVQVDLRAGSAGTGVAHFPEVVFFGSVEDALRETAAFHRSCASWSRSTPSSSSPSKTVT